MYTFTTQDGSTAHVGENQNENALLLQQCQQNWWWLHASNVPSGHAILETNTPTKAEIKEVAYEVFKRCKGRKIDYCLFKYVKRTTTPGLVELKRRPKTLTF